MFDFEEMIQVRYLPVNQVNWLLKILQECLIPAIVVIVVVLHQAFYQTPHTAWFFLPFQNCPASIDLACIHLRALI